MAACSFIALLTNCPDAIIVDGLLPINTNIVYTIRDKFDNITTVEVTTDGDGKFTIDPALFPLGIFNDFAGTFELLVYANLEDATNLENQLGLTLCDVEYFSVVFSFTESEQAGVVIPNCDHEQPVDDNTDTPCVTNPIDAFCQTVRTCLGISATANIDLFLNRRGQWVEITGGAVDSVNGQTGVVVLDADDIDDATTTNKFVTQAQINTWNALIGGSIFQTVWNATTNTPALSSGVGTKGYYYIVNVAGSTNLDGITDWKVGDWAIFDGTVWRKVDNTDAVSSVNGQTGAVSLTAADVGAPSGSGTSTGNNTGDQDLSGLVPYTGATSDVNLGNNSITAKNAKIEGTGGNGFIELLPQNTGVATPASGVRLWVDNAGRLGWRSASGYAISFDDTGLNGSRNYVLPNASGTLALTSDLDLKQDNLLISSATASNNAVIDFTLPSGYKSFEIRVISLIPSTDNVGMWIRVSTDGGATFAAGASDYRYQRNIQVDTTPTLVVSANDTKIITLGAAIGNGVGRYFNAFINVVDNENASTYKNIQCKLYAYNSAGAFSIGFVNGVYQSNTAINAIRILMSSGNIASGTFELWGYK